MRLLDAASRVSDGRQKRGRVSGVFLTRANGCISDDIGAGNSVVEGPIQLILIDGAFAQ